MPRREYCFGIYMFADKETGAIVYIGKDSHIDVNERMNAHYRPSAYDSQPINRVLQNNPDRYEYKVYCHLDTFDEMNQLEFDLINIYRPKFNFKHGGDGGFIDYEFTYTVVKNGISPTGNQKYVIKNMNHKELISSIDFDFLEEICEKLNKEELTPTDIKLMGRRTIPPFKSKLKKSKSNASGFFRVRKRMDNTCKQGFLWVYEYYENKKHKTIQRVNFFDLKKEVEKKNMVWCIVDIDKAIVTTRSIVTV